MLKVLVSLLGLSLRNELTVTSVSVFVNSDLFLVLNQFFFKFFTL